MSDICVTPHDSDRRALPSIRLCGSCYDHLTDDLAALPRLHHDLAAVLSTGTTTRTGGYITGSSSEPLPINPAVADHRDQITHDLRWWCVAIADARGLALPTNDLPSIAAWLGLHADWIAANLPAAAELPPVLRGLVRRARALLAPSGARRIEIGPCLTDEDEELCKGTLYATVRADDDPRPSLIYCPVCGFEKGPEEWRKFGRNYLRERRMAG